MEEEFALAEMCVNDKSLSLYSLILPKGEIHSLFLFKSTNTRRFHSSCKAHKHGACVNLSKSFLKAPSTYSEYMRDIIIVAMKFYKLENC